MPSVMSRPETSLCTPNITLKKIWKVTADSNYDVICHKKRETIVAVRTIAGKGTFFFKEESFILEENSLAFFKYGDVKRYKSTGDFWKYVWFEFEANIIFIPTDKKVILPLTTEEENKVENCFNYLSLPGYAMIASQLFSELLFYWLQNIGNFIKNDLKLDQIILKMIQNYDDISIQELATEYGVSERQFRNIFYKQIGKTPKEFICDRKLNAAKDFLASTNLSIKEISDSLGYNSPYYFSRAFKKKFNKNPSDIRKK